METLHAALPPRGEGIEKWVIQLWFRPYKMTPVKRALRALQTAAGIPLKGDEALPPGTSAIKKSASESILDANTEGV
jgi:hypothetical protein